MAAVTLIKEQNKGTMRRQKPNLLKVVFGYKKHERLVVTLSPVRGTVSKNIDRRPLNWNLIRRLFSRRGKSYTLST